MNKYFYSTSLVLLSTFAHAQSPYSNDAINRPNLAPLPPTPYLPSHPSKDFVLPPVPSAALPLQNNPTRIFIERVRFSGNTVFSSQELHELARELEGRAVSVSDIEALRQKVTRYYIDAGYVTSGALIPKNGIQQHELHLQIIEGRFDDVRIKGSDGLREDYIADRLVPEPDAPLNLTDLQDRFQLLLSDPLIERMNGRLLPSGALGHDILDVEVSRALPYQLTLVGNNYRPPSIGGEAVGASGVLRNLTGWGDSLDMNFMISEGSTRYNGGFSVPLGNLGTTAFFRFDEGDSMIVEQPASRIDIKSQVHSLEGGLSQTLLESLRQRFSLGVSVGTRQNDARVFNQGLFVPSGHTQATVVRFFQDYLQRWTNQALGFRSTFSLGIDALGATAQSSANSEFFAWLGQGQYAYRFAEQGGQFVLRGAVQLNNQALLPLERLAIGGVNTVRGYRENTLVRDQGYSLSAEFHYPLLGGGDSRSNYSLNLIPFFDWGQGWNHDASGTETLYSVGIGLNGRYKQLNSDFYYGHALKRPTAHTANDLQDDGIHFQLRVDVF